MEKHLSVRSQIRSMSPWRRGLVFVAALAICCSHGFTQEQKPVRKVLVRDITTISGVRDNPLLGYGIVVGLHGTGDSQQTVFTTQSLAAAMLKFGVQFPTASSQVKNVAAVFVTASLPPFAGPGLTLDVSVSSVGDAKSLEGGVLLMTSLRGADGQVYALAQGPLTLGGYSVGKSNNLKMTNHATVGTVPGGAVVERDTAIDLNALKSLSFNLREPDFTAAHDVADAINKEIGKQVAVALDGRRIDLNVADAGLASVTALISRVQNIGIVIHPRAKVVMNERTGTIVMGGDVTLTPVAVLHGNLSIEVTTKLEVSQPAPHSKGETVVVPETTLSAQDNPAKTIRMTEGASVEELINGLHAIGASSRDIVAILQAIKAAGGLQAELEVM
jgi:flagellar P-ring protein precursor FlgI